MKRLQIIKKTLKDEAELRSKAEVENQLLEAVANDITVDIPDVMVDNQIDYQIQQLSYQLMYQGMKIEDYLQYIGKTIEDLRKDYKEGAAKQVKMCLAVEALIKKIGIKPTKEEVAKRLEELAAEAGKTVQEYKDMMGGEELDYFNERVAMEKLFDYLVEKAVIEDVEKIADKKEPVKKAPAKKAAEKKPAEKKAEKKTDEKKSADK
ncbi:MAG: hypothetical protein RR777_02285 [Christensenellaceae bacterium]